MSWIIVPVSFHSLVPKCCQNIFLGPSILAIVNHYELFASASYVKEAEGICQQLKKTVNSTVHELDISAFQLYLENFPWIELQNFDFNQVSTVSWGY